MPDGAGEQRPAIRSASCTSEAKKFAIAFSLEGGAIQLHALPDEIAAADSGTEPIEQPFAEPERHQRDGGKRHRVGEDRQCPGIGRNHHRQHRDAGLGVVLALGRREAPEMRRRPQEQRHRQHGRNHLRRRIDGRRSGEHRETSGKAADHDVPGAAALQPHRIDDAVGEGAEEDIGRRDVACGDRREPERRREQPRNPTSHHGLGLNVPLANGRARVRRISRSTSRS